jgi:hypothetical protein
MCVCTPRSVQVCPRERRLSRRANASRENQREGREEPFPLPTQVRSFDGHQCVRPAQEEAASRGAEGRKEENRTHVLCRRAFYEEESIAGDGRGGRPWQEMDT